MSQHLIVSCPQDLTILENPRSVEILRDKMNELGSRYRGGKGIKLSHGVRSFRREKLKSFVLVDITISMTLFIGAKFWIFSRKRESFDNVIKVLL